MIPEITIKISMVYEDVITAKEEIADVGVSVPPPPEEAQEIVEREVSVPPTPEEAQEISGGEVSVPPPL